MSTSTHAVRSRLLKAVRLTVPLAAVALVLGTGGPVAASVSPSSLSATALTPDSTITGSKSQNLAETDPSLLGQTSSGLINVMIKYDYAPTASYMGGVDGLAATSPKVTGKSLKQNATAVQSYEAYRRPRRRASAPSPE